MSTHQGAVTRARTEMDMGSNPAAIEMAHAIAVTQTEEIEPIDRIVASL